MSQQRNRAERGREAYNSGFDQKGMDYVKGILSGLAAIFLAEFLPGSWSIFRGMSHEKATGLAAFTGGLAESVFSPLFWALAVLFFVLFFVLDPNADGFCVRSGDCGIVHIRVYRVQTSLLRSMKSAFRVGVW